MSPVRTAHPPPRPTTDPAGRPRAGGAVVLCNAEPFGFGPAASLAQVLPHLRDLFEGGPAVSPQYVGSGHTLALNRLRTPQHPGGFDKVHDIDVYAPGGPEALARLCEALRPTLFLTVSDAAAASAALGAGVPVVIIDLLLWFWPRVPAPWQGARQVLAADFEGVRERALRDGLGNVTVVPPIAPALRPAGLPRDGVVLNMGGLRNPYVPASEHVAYAQVIDKAMRRAVARCQVDTGRASGLDVLAGPEIVQALGPLRARTVGPADTQGLLRRSRLVCMTPGLGNLFEASACAQDVLVLPPANDSQGRQMRLLASKGWLDQVVDWHDLVGGPPIDYWKPQQEVLRDIQSAQQTLLKSGPGQARLARRMATAIDRSAQPPSAAPALRGLIDSYGNGGAAAMAR
ncbi:MAG TPA: hypothetical protein VFH51_16875, partial [Myxococcota bacterium]|nr:hypothetical protein [Myxococcota bacterium]